MTSKTLYLIDGSSYIFRAYFAVKHLSTSSGFPTNAVYGFTSMLFKFMKDYNPKYIGMVFDSKGRTFRNDIYPLYKANRELPPEDLVPQFEKIYEVVKAFSIPIIQKDGFEADDLMGTVAKESEKKGYDVILVTGDKDFYQLVSEKITLLDTMKNRSTEIKDVVDRFGVRPEKVIEIFALAGDAVDNIPGVRGIGGKTASKLIAEFDSLEGVYKNIDTLKGKQKEVLASSREDAFLSKKLVTIKTDVDIDGDYSDFQYNGYDENKLLTIFNELEFNNLKRELTSVNSSGESIEKSNNSSKLDYSNYRLIFSLDELEDLIEETKSTKELSIDLETTSPLPMLAEIVGIAISHEPNTGFYIPIKHEDTKEQLPIDQVLKKLKPVIESSNIRKIGQNLKYEIIVLSKYGLKIKGLHFDTMVAAHLLDSSRNSYKLDELSKIFLGHEMISYKDVTTKGKSKVGFEKVGLEDAKEYASEDSDVAMQIYKILYSELEASDLLHVYNNRILKLIPVLAQMEINGVKIDANLLKGISNDFDKELDQISRDIYSKVGYEFNLNSPLQLREILFEKLGLDVKKRTKKGEPSTDHEVLVQLSSQHIVPDLVLKYRALSKLKSTYVDSLSKLISSKTQRIHTSYNPVGTSTGRLSSSDPNLQNIPIKSPEGRRIREAFIPEDGFVFLSADYSQIELRLLAHFSEDERLVNAFINDSDIHSRTAAEIFGVEEKSVKPDMRRLAKNINFGIIYGISAFGLSKQIGSSISESKKYIEQYFNRYSRVKGYLDSSVKEAQNRGYALTILGRKRPIPELNSRNRVQRGIGERAAINTPIQGSAADIINLAMINISEKISEFSSKMILQVHDELIFEVKENELDKIKEIVKNEMENAYKLNVPLKVDMGTGLNWSEAH